MRALKQSVEIMIMNTDGTGAHRIADRASSLQNPVWAAGGKHIYLKKEVDSATLIYCVNTKGKKITEVCRILKKIGGFDVSPDGNSIVLKYSEHKK